MVKLIVLDQRINSMTEFNRLLVAARELERKRERLILRLWISAMSLGLFADPDWTDRIEIDDNYPPKDTPSLPQAMQDLRTYPLAFVPVRFVVSILAFVHLRANLLNM